MPLFYRQYSHEQLERQKQKAEIREIESRSFINFCTGLSTITPLLKHLIIVALVICFSFFKV